MIITKKEHKFLHDTPAKKILSDEDTRDYTIKVVGIALGIDEDYLKKNIRYASTKVSDNINYKNNEVDVLYETDDEYINIEINYNYSEGLLIKNSSYVCHLYLKQFGRGDKYNNLKPINQININNYDIYHKRKFIYESYMMEKNEHIIRDKSIRIIDINLDLLAELDYNVVKESTDSLEKLLYIFVIGDLDEAEKFYEGDEIMQKVIKKLKDLHTYDDVLYYNREEAKKIWEEEEMFNEGKKQGIEQGIVQGIEQANIENARKMLKKGFDNQTIMEITGLSSKQLDEIKKES